MENFNAKIGAKIRAARLKKHMTQKQLAEKLHVSQTAVALWENGTRGFTVSTACRMADILDIENIFDIAEIQSEPLTEEQEKEIEYQTAQAIEKLKLQELGYELTNPLEDRTRKAFHKLNRDGREKVTVYAEDLTKIPEYQKEKEDH